jgi:hypothetical protein
MVKEVSSAIKSLKNSSALRYNGLPAELFKYAGPFLIGKEHATAY